MGSCHSSLHLSCVLLMMMIGKERLSGLWVGPERVVLYLHLRSVSPYVSCFFSLAQRTGAVSAISHNVMLSHAATAARLGGSWVSATWIVASAPFTGHPMLMLSMFADGPRVWQHTRCNLFLFIQSASLSNELVFAFVFFWGCACGLVSFVCFCWWFLRQIDGLCKCPHSMSDSLSFAAISSDGSACFSQFIFGKYKPVQRPGESYEGRRKKKETGPRRTDGSVVWPALTDCRIPAGPLGSPKREPPKTGAEHKKKNRGPPTKGQCLPCGEWNRLAMGRLRIQVAKVSTVHLNLMCKGVEPGDVSRALYTKAQEDAKRTEQFNMFAHGLAGGSTTVLQCDLRDPGWDDPGFRHCDFFALAPTAHPVNLDLSFSVSNGWACWYLAHKLPCHIFSHCGVLWCFPSTDFLFLFLFFAVWVLFVVCGWFVCFRFQR